jgi:hypothetical protein
VEIATWIGAGILPALYLTAGALTTTQPLEPLAGPLSWTTSPDESTVLPMNIVLLVAAALVAAARCGWL